MKVWITTDGEYSDYHITGVFSEEPRALSFVAQEGGEAEEWEMDMPGWSPGLRPFYMPGWSPGLRPFYVVMTRDGKCLQAQHAFLCGSNCVLAITDREDGVKVLRGDCWATDIQHAEKIANEKRAQLIANGQWE